MVPGFDRGDRPAPPVLELPTGMHRAQMLAGVEVGGLGREFVGIEKAIISIEEGDQITLGDRHALIAGGGGSSVGLPEVPQAIAPAPLQLRHDHRGVVRRSIVHHNHLIADPPLGHHTGDRLCQIGPTVVGRDNHTDTGNHRGRGGGNSHEFR